jgi:hypothetical protein
LEYARLEWTTDEACRAGVTLDASREDLNQTCIKPIGISSLAPEGGEIIRSKRRNLLKT